MQASSAQLWENIQQCICINELASRPTLYLHSSCFCSLSPIFSKSSKLCQAWSKSLVGLRVSLRSKKPGKENWSFWYAGKLGKNMQNLKEVKEWNPWRARGDREWVRLAPPAGTVRKHLSSPCPYSSPWAISASVGMPALKEAKLYRNVISDGIRVFWHNYRAWPQGRACWVLTLRSEPCTTLYSKGVLPGGLSAARQKVLWVPPGAEQGNMLRREQGRKKERHSECRCVLKIHFHHLFLKASVNSFKFHWNLIHIWGIFTFVHWLGVLQKDEKMFLLFLHIDLF